MNDISSTLIIIFASIALVCLIILEILIRRGKKLDKEIAQCEEVQKALARGISHEELMQMPMPKKLRKGFEKVNELEKQYNEEMNEIAKKYMEEISKNETDDL